MTTQELKVRFVLRQHLNEFRFAVLGKRVILFVKTEDLDKVLDIEHDTKTYFNLWLNAYCTKRIWRNHVRWEADWLNHKQKLSDKDYRRIIGYSWK